MKLQNITQPFFDRFPGDFSGDTQQRQTPGQLFATVQTAGFENPRLLAFNEELSVEIGLGRIENEIDTAFLNASFVPPHLKTYATAYAGHQFGNWAGQLGDGRAIFAGEIVNAAGVRTELQWKGAGATPYSRHADGRAVLRSSVREFLVSEAMHGLQVPTTRALSLSLTGEEVVRDILYSGNPQLEKGAVIMRTAESFLRFGHFELLAAQGRKDLLADLADFTVEKYFPEITATGVAKYAEFFRQIVHRTVKMMVGWYRTGFTHGVMNTDNMSVLGLTIDYGPFSFLDEYDLNFTPNTTDMPGRRYAFGRQAQVAQWNLWQLANALYPLIEDEKILRDFLDSFTTLFWKSHDEMLAKKFGLSALEKDDSKFFTEAQQVLSDAAADYTLFFRYLENCTPETDILRHFKPVFYRKLSEEEGRKFVAFIKKYFYRVNKNASEPEKRRQLMRHANPKFILRNYLLFEAIQQVEKGDMTLFNKLWQAAKDPYVEHFPEFSARRPATYDGQAGCSTLSCSS